MKINGKSYRTVWMDGGFIKTINQLRLPDRFEIISINHYRAVIHAIETMIVRGAPAIGGMGAYGLAQAIDQLPDLDHHKIVKIKQEIQKARPTAYDLRYALDFVYNRIKDEQNLNHMKQEAKEAAEEYADLNVAACKQIGEYGNGLINDGDKILTHCNAGALATIDYGTALAPLRRAHYEKKSILVYVNETRPRLQGAKLTAWELFQEGIPHVIIADNAAGYYLQKGTIDLVITGSDRIALNGDAANKIGTYAKAVVAKANNIPFYIAAPISTIDFKCASGDEIPIEERDEREVLEIDGKRIASKGSHAKNPAFDVTPAKFITGIITEKGILKPEEIKKLDT